MVNPSEVCLKSIIRRKIAKGFTLGVMCVLALKVAPDSSSIALFGTFAGLIAVLFVFSFSLVLDGCVGSLFLAKGRRLTVDFIPIAFQGKYRHMFGFAISGSPEMAQGKYQISGLTSDWKKRKFILARHEAVLCVGRSFLLVHDEGTAQFVWLRPLRGRLKRMAM